MLVQICTPEPCKFVLMTDKKKGRLLCMRQILCGRALQLSSLLHNLLQASRQQIHHVVWLGQVAGQARRLGYKRDAATISLAVCCKAVKVARVPAAMLAAFEDIKLRPNSMTVLAFPDHILAL